MALDRVVQGEKMKENKGQKTKCTDMIGASQPIMFLFSVIKVIPNSSYWK